MKNCLNKTLLIILLCVVYFVSYGQVTKNITLNETSDSKTSSTHKYQVTIIIDTVQKGNGLKFRLLVKNISGQISTIENPVSNFPFTLMDETGKSVNIVDVNSKLINQSNKSNKLKRDAFDIDKITVNGTDSKSVKDTSTYITFNSGETIETQLSIKQIIKRKSPKQHTDNQKVTITNGKYTLFTTLIIMEVKEKNVVNPILFTGKLVSIQYK